VVCYCDFSCLFLFRSNFPTKPLGNSSHFHLFVSLGPSQACLVDLK
jgi:hypothetical protein